MPISDVFDASLDTQKAEVLYLKREAHHEHEKPYKLRYDPGNGFPRTNCANEPHSISIQSLRGNEDRLTLERDGFAWLPLRSSLSPDQFYKAENVKSQYYSEIRSLIMDYLRPSHLKVLEHQVRHFI